MRRQIIGKIYKLDDTPWINAKGNIILFNGAYTDTVQYPSNQIPYITNTVGDVLGKDGQALSLWVNEEGNIASRYRFILPDGKFFEFTIPVGASPVSLSILRENLNEQAPNYQSIVNYVDTEIDSRLGQQSYYKVFNALPTQSVYQLDAVSVAPDKSKVYFNGAKQRHGVDYNINGINLNLSFNLPHPFILEVYY